MIFFEDWTIRTDGDILARQYDNLSRTLNVTGDIPAGWDWAMLVQVGEAMDIISLSAEEASLSAVLTARQLSVAGYYQMQLRAVQGNLVQHTNTINVYIPASLSGDEQWPAVPSEFSEMERRINEKAKQIEGYAVNPPAIGENGNWWGWDGTAYADTGKPSRGERGIQGEPGCTPRKGVDYYTEADKQEVIERAESKFNNLYANALKGTARGETVRLDDVSPLEHGVPVRVSSKNLVPYPYYHTTTTVNGVTFTDNGDGTITANGTATENANFQCCLWSSCATPAGLYTFTCGAVKGVTMANIAIKKDSGQIGEVLCDTHETESPINIELKDDADMIYLQLRVVKGASVENFVFKPQLELGTTATAYTPYVDDLSGVTVTASRKNLSPVTSFVPTESAQSGVINIKNVREHGAYTLSAKVTKFSDDTATNTRISIIVYYTNGTVNSVETVRDTSFAENDGIARFKTVTIKTDASKEIDFFKIVVLDYTTSADRNAKAEEIQFEYSPYATTFEEYKGVTYIPTEDGTCEVTSIAPNMAISTDTVGVVMDCEYNRDINKAFEQLTQAIISMGGNI